MSKDKTWAWKQEFGPDRNDGIFTVVWVINAPWAHPLWSQYIVALYDLTNSPESRNGGVIKIHKKGMTHEVMVNAVNPDTVIQDEPPLQPKSIGLLEPANHGYQFKADSDQAAEERIQSIVDSIVAGNLSPDTDFRTAWDGIFADGVTLHRFGFDAPIMEAPDEQKH